MATARWPRPAAADQTRSPSNASSRLLCVALLLFGLALLCPRRSATLRAVQGVPQCPSRREPWGRQRGHVLPKSRASTRRDSPSHETGHHLQQKPMTAGTIRSVAAAIKYSYLLLLVVVVCCHALPCVAMRCHALPCAAMCCYALPCAATRCYALLCAAMRCYLRWASTLRYHCERFAA